MLLRIVVFVVAALLFHPALAERKVALLIGNAAYSAPATELKNPPNDVATLKATLEDAAFEVEVAQNLGRAAMSQVLAAFEEKAAGADIGLIYYSGHGIEVNGDNFLLPVDARLASDRDVKYEAIQLDDLVASLSRVSKLKLVLLDACRDNPFLTAMKRFSATRGAVTRGLARVETAESNMLIGYATAPGDVALDGDGDSSPYAQALARHLVAPGREVEVALRAVARDVFEATGGKQRPFITGSLFETVVLGAPADGASASGIDPCRDAAAHWAAIGGRKDKTLLEEHLRHFRGCAFASLARLEIAALAPTADTREPVTGGAPETACDRLAAQPGDPMKLASVGGVGFNDIALPDALTACRAAVRDFPGDIRLRYQLGRVLDKSGDDMAALEEYRVAAAAGHMGATNNIGSIFHNGETVAQDYAEAMTWYRKAAEGGDDTAMNNVGNLYSRGQGVPRDDAEALAWYRRAAEAGSIDGLHNVGYFYDLGRGVKTDYREAMAWYRKAAALGNAVSMNNIGTLYRNGEGVRRDYAEAMAWYRKAVDAGSALAMQNIGGLYKNGHGVKRDHAEAMRWFREAADKGEPSAFYNIAVLYDDGNGVSRDRPEAARNMEIALRRGHDLALKEMKTNSGAWSADFRKALQQRLKDAGVYDGTVDGRLGPGTIRAMEEIFNKS